MKHCPLKHSFLYPFVGFCLFLFFAFSLAASAQSRVMETLKLNSKIMGKDVKFGLYLPPDYYTSNRRYPVVYLLHGYSDDETGWMQFGEAPVITDQLINKGEIAPVIIVMPDAGVTWYINDYLGKTRYEDMFIKELIPMIDSTYRTRAKKEFRAITGLSMGGYGTCILAMHNPELFVAAAPMSAAFIPDEDLTAMPEGQYNSTFGFLYGPAKGSERLTANWKKNSTLEQAKTMPEDKLKSIKWYFDCGDDDFLYKGNAQMHTILMDRKIPHEYRMRDGGHTWTYWRTALPEVLKFFSVSFHR